MIGSTFFEQDCCALARSLLGKVLRRLIDGQWSAARIVDTEAYYTAEKGSHASLGRTPSREALFMPAGTLYLYHSRGGDSLNISARGDGNAVLIKAAVPVEDEHTTPGSVDAMLRRNPMRTSGALRPVHRLCAGQTLLCASLDLKIRAWTGRPFAPETFFLDDDGYRPAAIVLARRLGIPPGRDEHLLYRYVDAAHLGSATDDPTRKRAWREGRDWFLLAEGAPDPNPTHGSD